MNEKALVRLMKEAYKGGGVKVCRVDWSYLDLLVISTGFWAVSMPMEQAPGKVLGLLGEWLRRLPLIGEAYLLRNKADPERLDPAQKSATELLSRREGCQFAVDLKPTPFYVGNKRALQRRDDRQMLFFTAGLLELVDGFLHTGATDTDGDLAQWQQVDTDITVWICPRVDVDPERAAILAKYNSWLEGARA
ncbi:hypothetical protein [Allofournierella sp.]|uniref:hypothetical protein n=1 Tax=Allofournierella sp. TaxID=1940256 RepID=UPI003AF14742